MRIQEKLAAASSYTRRQHATEDRRKREAELRAAVPKDELADVFD